MTLKTCSLLYRFPRSHPINIVETLPKLRRMMWTGTLMLNAKAQLFSMLMLKNIAAISTHLRRGTFGFSRGELLLSVHEICEGAAATTVKMNWKKVIRRPTSSAQPLVQTRSSFQSTITDH